MGSPWSDWVPPSAKAPDLVPMYGPRSFTPATPCREVHGAIAQGSRLYCEVCSKSGLDHLRLPGEPVGSRINPGFPAATPTAPPPAGGRGARPTLKGGRR